MPEFDVELRAEVTYRTTITTDESGDAPSLAGDEFRRQLPTLPDGLSWVVFHVTVRRRG